jgi:hypothetical protein
MEVVPHPHSRGAPPGSRRARGSFAARQRWESRPLATPTLRCRPIQPPLLLPIWPEGGQGKALPDALLPPSVDQHDVSLRTEDPKCLGGVRHPNEPRANIDASPYTDALWAVGFPAVWPPRIGLTRT